MARKAAEQEQSLIEPGSPLEGHMIHIARLHVSEKAAQEEASTYHDEKRNLVDLVIAELVGQTDADVSSTITHRAEIEIEGATVPVQVRLIPSSRAWTEHVPDSYTQGLIDEIDAKIASLQQDRNTLQEAAPGTERSSTTWSVRVDPVKQKKVKPNEKWTID